MLLKVFIVLLYKKIFLIIFFFNILVDFWCNFVDKFLSFNILVRIKYLGLLFEFICINVFKIVFNVVGLEL